MTSNLVEEWFDKKFVPSIKRFNELNGLPPQVLILINNALSHPSDMQLVWRHKRRVSTS